MYIHDKMNFFCVIFLIFAASSATLFAEAFVLPQSGAAQGVSTDAADSDSNLYSYSDSESKPTAISVTLGQQQQQHADAPDNFEGQGISDNAFNDGFMLNNTDDGNSNDTTLLIIEIPIDDNNTDISLDVGDDSSVQKVPVQVVALLEALEELAAANAKMGGQSSSSSEYDSSSSASDGTLSFATESSDASSTDSSISEDEAGRSSSQPMMTTIVVKMSNANELEREEKPMNNNRAATVPPYLQKSV